MAAPARLLLEHLRAELHTPGLDYAEPLTPITGGYDTRIFTFRLTGASEPFSIPLILRVLSNQYAPERALSERATQNAVAGLGYPAPRVLLASSDPTILGGAFLVMERLAGRPLLNARRLGIASVLVELQLRLHALDAEVLLQALDREGQASSRVGAPPISREVVTVEGHLTRLEARIRLGRLPGLETAMAWLSNRRPTGERRRVICHGDFHPQNILMADGRVTGVVDWPNVIVADPAFDVAATRVILGLVPVGLLGVPPALRGLVEVARRILAARYCKRVPAPAAAERLAAGLLRSPSLHARVGPNGGARLAPIGESGLNPLDASGFGERLGARFRRLTGITLRLPPVLGGAQKAHDNQYT
jgi:aminoglycoside phosphotransferase (APT) family kinase protein